MKLYFIILILFIIIILYYLINNFLKKNELFTSVSGSQATSDGSTWTSGSSDSSQTTAEESCNEGGQCKTEDGFGTYNSKCDCIVDKTAEEEEPVKKAAPATVPQITIPAETIDLTGCYPNNTNFDAICKRENSEYGIKEVTACTNTHSKVTCDRNYLDGVNYHNTVITPCLNKSDDFDVWCNFYNNKPTPPGFNVNSIGANKILVGKKGDCYNNNGTSDNSSARAICDYNHVNTLYKLELAVGKNDILSKLDPTHNIMDTRNSNDNDRSSSTSNDDNDSKKKKHKKKNHEIMYNVFTHCRPLKNTNFTQDCSRLLNVDYDNTFADQILGYDCNPGFGRAKCIISKRKSSGNHYDSSYVLNSDGTTTSNDSCEC